MPTLPDVAKAVRIDHHHAQAGAPNIQIRNFYRYGGVLSEADAVTWLATIQGAYATFVNAVMVTALTYTFSVLTDLTSVTAPQVINSTGGAGGDANVGNPGGLALVIKCHVPRRYRGGHCRVYLPGIHPRHLNNPTTWKTADASAIEAAYVTYVNAVVSGAPVAVGVVTAINISYFHGFTVTEGPTGRPRIVPTPRATPIVDAITNYAYNPAPASQRRRNATP